MLIFGYYDLFILIMGLENSKQKSNQSQLIEQNYANNIMLLALSTLQSICCKILSVQSKSSLKKFGQQDKVDYSFKNMQQLISQLKTHLFLFKVSKQSMEIQFQSGFVFPKTFTKQDAINQISIFKSICMKSGNNTLISFCEDFINILMGKYTNLFFQTADVKVVYNEKEKEAQKRNLLKDGINATNTMNKLREEVQSSGIQHPSELIVKLNVPKIEYEKVAKNTQQKVK